MALLQTQMLPKIKKSVWVLIEFFRELSINSLNYPRLFEKKIAVSELYNLKVTFQKSATVKQLPTPSPYAPLTKFCYIKIFKNKKFHIF